MNDHRDEWYDDGHPFDPHGHRGRRRGEHGHGRGRRHRGFGPVPPIPPVPPMGPVPPMPPAPPGGFGWPFEPHHHRGRRPRMRRGDVRSAILSLLVEQPRNGYQLIRELAERSGGMWRPSPGSVYPALQQMEDEGLVRAVDVDGKRTFDLTEDGRRYTEENADRLRDPWQALRSSIDDDLVEFQHLLGQVVTAAQQVAAAGGPGQLGKARELLASTRRGMYRILAEDEDEPFDGDPGNDE